MTSTCSRPAFPCRPGNGWPPSDTWQPAPLASGWPATSPALAGLLAGPYPRGTADEHQREPEGQVLDRCIGDATIANEHDPPRTQDGVVAVSHDASPCQPAVGDQLKDHDDPVGHPPRP